MNFIHKLFVFFLIFFFILSPRVDLKVVIHTGILSVVLLAILVALRQRNLFSLPKKLVVIATFFLFLGIYHFVFASLYGNNGGYFTMICFTIIISVVFGWLVASYLVNHGADASDLLDQLLVMCTIVAILNATIILVEYALPEIKSIIESHLLQVLDANINYAEHPFRFRGLASAGGAALSVFHAMTIVSIIFLLINKKITAVFALLGALVLTCSNIFTGRTGLILSILFTFVLLMIILVQNFKSGYYGFVRNLGLVIFTLFLFNFFANFDLDPEAASWAFEWANNMGSGKLETASSEDLKTVLFLPDDPIHLLFGVGFFEGIGGVYPRTDSGYLKTILSIGVPLSILLYSAIIFMFFQVTKVSAKYFWLVISIVCVMLFIEIKEPFLYQNFTARMIFLLSGAAMFLLAKRRALKGS